MTNIVHEVWKFLDKNPNIRREMSRGLINYSALARYIIKEKNIKGNMDGVISAIRRYKIDQDAKFVKDSGKILSQISISTRSKIASIAIKKDSESQKKLPELFSIVDYIRGDVLRITQADESIVILVDEKNLDKIMKLFPEDKIINMEKRLAEINLHLSSDAKHTPGIVSVVSNELTMNGINIMEFMSCIPEMLWFVKEKDILKAYNALYQLSCSK